MRPERAILAVAIGLALLSPRASSAAPVVVLTWEAMPGATGYEVEVGTDADLTAPVVRQTTDSPRLEWAVLPERPYQWRVRARYVFGRHGQWSAVRTIAQAVWPVTLEHPGHDGEVVAREGARVINTFRTSPALSEYHVEIAHDPTFVDRVVDVRTRAGSVEWIPDRTGPFFWRVSAVDVLGRPVAASTPARFVVRPPASTHVAYLSPLAMTTNLAFALAAAPLEDLVALPDDPYFEPIPAIPSPAPARVRETSLHAGAGWRSDFSRAIVSPVVGASREMAGGMTGMVTVSGFRSSARLDVAEATLSAGADWRLGARHVISVHAGPVFQAVHARERGFAAGIGGGVAIDRPLGKGRWYVGLDVRAGGWEGRSSRLSAHGLFLQTGVRLGR